MLVARCQVEGMGHGLFATRSIEKGALLLVENPLVFVTEKPPSSEQCGFPFSCVETSFVLGFCYQSCASNQQTRCEGCGDLFCSLLCLQQACERFHTIECTASPHVRCASLSLLSSSFLRQFLCFSQGVQMQRFKQHILCSRWHIGLAVGRILLHMILALQRGEVESVLKQYLTFCAAPFTDSLTPNQVMIILIF